MPNVLGRVVNRPGPPGRQLLANATPFSAPKTKARATSPGISPEPCGWSHGLEPGAIQERPLLRIGEVILVLDEQFLIERATLGPH